MSILSSAVKIADKITTGLNFRTSLTLKQFTKDAGVGDPAFKTVKCKAIVSYKQKLVRGTNGQMLMSMSNVTFLDPKIVIRADDRITFIDGTGGPVISVDSPVDATGRLMTQAFL